MVKYIGINLKVRTDRRRQFEAEIDQAGLEVQIIDAVDGNNPAHLAYYEQLPQPKHYNPRELACTLSHIKGLELALAGEADDYVVMLEDDVILENEFKAEVTKALKSAPNRYSILYLGYFIFGGSISRPIEGSSSWRRQNPVYGTHCYAVRWSFIPTFIAKLKQCDRQIDNYMTDILFPHSAIYQRCLAYQHLESPSDINMNYSLVNPVNTFILNPFKLNYIWPPLPAKTEFQPTPKLLHVLPGQRLYFALPQDWTAITWTYFDELSDYYRYAGKIPFAFWLIYHYGGLVFMNQLSPSIARYWTPDTCELKPDVMMAPPGHVEVVKAMKRYVDEADAQIKLNPHAPKVRPATGF